jgi:glycosyltransferase involved in cell wall biosynthesis
MNDIVPDAGVGLSIVVPLKDESRHIAALLAAIHAALENIEDAYEIILVDDGSRDNSWRLITEMAADSRVRGLRFCRNFGKEAALRAGLEHSLGDAVVTMDADLQHPPRLLGEMVRRWRSEATEMVEAVRRDPAKRPFLSQIGASVVYGIFRRVTGVDMEGRTDYRLLDRSVVDFICSLPERATFFRGMVAWYSFSSVPVFFEVPERAEGRSRWSFLRLVNFGIDVVTSFTNIPLRLMSFFSAGFLAFSAVLMVQTIYRYVSGHAVEGFTTVILSVLLVGGVVTAGLGIVGEYLARVYEEGKGRPRYRISEQAGIRPRSIRPCSERER